MESRSKPEERLCRFCFETALAINNPLISPCDCKGTQEFIHIICLNRWREINPAQNMIQCFVCKTPYTYPLDYQLEKIPESTFMNRPLRYPYVWYTIYHYISMIMTVSVNPKNHSQIVGELRQYEIVFHLMYILLALAHFEVKKKRRYFKHWNREYRWVCIPFHFFMCFLIFLYPDSYGFMMSGLYLPIYWRTHIMILHEMNAEDRQ